MPEYFLFLILLIAALSHAICHSLLKQSNNPLGLLGITSLYEILIFSPLVFYVPLPSSYIWVLIISSALLHGLYRLIVLYSYRFGDLSFVYPIARGGSSILLATISIILLNEKISLLGFLAIVIICIGLFLISYTKINQFNKIAFTLGLLTSLMIVSYTLIDGIGIRQSENAYTYLYWMLLLNGTPVLIASLMFKNNGLRNINKDLLIKGTCFGFLAPLAYGLAVWCMQYMPIAFASAIRETSILFATLIGLLILKEKKANSRIIPSIFIVIGIGILYFQI